MRAHERDGPPSRTPRSHPGRACPGGQCHSGARPVRLRSRMTDGGSESLPGPDLGGGVEAEGDGTSPGPEIGVKPVGLGCGALRSGGDAGGFGVWDGRAGGGGGSPPGPGAGVIPVRLGCRGEPWSPPWSEAEVLPVGLGCGMGEMPVPRRMRARIGKDRPALAPVPPQPPVPPSQLTWASTSSCCGFMSPTRPLMVRCGRLCPAPAAAKAPSTSPGPPLAPPGPARPPAHPCGLGPCPTPARPVSARRRLGMGDWGGAGGDGGIGDVGSQRGLGTIEGYGRHGGLWEL